MTTFHIITLFPDAVRAYVHSSILGRAEKRRKVRYNFVDLRQFGLGKHLQVDDTPYGGGAGMVLMPEPLIKAVTHVQKKIRNKNAVRVILFSAKGEQFHQGVAHDLARRFEHIILVAGRYEGVDERVKKILKAHEISIGPYVLTDGDVAAMAVTSAVARLIPGVIKFESLAEESHFNLLLTKERSVPAGKGLEYPHYTRPKVLMHRGKRYRVPDILLSGNHKKIAEWRKKHMTDDR